MKKTLFLSVLIALTTGCLADTHECETCHHLFKSGGKMVLVYDFNNHDERKQIRSEWYCEKDKPSFNAIGVGFNGRTPILGVTEQANISNKSDATWVCHECQHLFKPGTGKDVSVSDFDSAHIPTSTNHFCKPCSPKYDRIVTGAYGPRYMKLIPPVAEKWVVVDVNGNDPEQFTLKNYWSTNNIGMTNIIWSYGLQIDK